MGMRWIDGQGMWHEWERGECMPSFFRKTEGNRPFGRSRHTWKDNITMYLQDTEWEVWRGFIWLRIGPNGRMVGFHKMLAYAQMRYLDYLINIYSLK
jgi:hypothetical protein